MNFTQTKRTPYIAVITNDDELDAFLDRAGVHKDHRDVACKLYDAMGSLTITNSTTGEYCIARDVPPMLRAQAI